MKLNKSAWTFREIKSYNLEQVAFLSDNRIKAVDLKLMEQQAKDITMKDLLFLADLYHISPINLVDIDNLSLNKILFLEDYILAKHLTALQFFEITNAAYGVIERLIYIIEAYYQNNLLVPQILKDIFHNSNHDVKKQLKKLDYFLLGIKYF